LLQDIKEIAKEVVGNIKETIGLKQDEENPAKAAFESISRMSQSAGQTIRQTMEQAGEKLPRYSREARDKEPALNTPASQSPDESSRAAAAHDGPHGPTTTCEQDNRNEAKKGESVLLNAEIQPAREDEAAHAEHVVSGPEVLRAGANLGQKEDKKVEEDKSEFRGQRSRL
jgi:hypothetical protein